MPTDVNLDGQAVGEWLRSAKVALDIVRGARALLPQGPKRDELDASIRSAEEALSRSDAALAKQLGYQLCQCSFPPHIMLWRQATGVYACPNEACGRQVQPAPVAQGTRAQAIPAARVCPLCQDEMKVMRETPHPHFAFAGVKVHHLKCQGCGNETTRDFRPSEGYR